MKISSTLAFFTGLFLVSCVQVKTSDDVLGNLFNVNKGTGAITQKTFEHDFSSLVVSTSITVDVVKSDTEKVIVSAPSDLLEYIKVENNGERLHLFIDTRFGNTISTERIKVTVYARDFNQLQANSSGTIRIKDTFVQDKLAVEATSSGEITGNLEANYFTITANSSGKFSGNIWADQADITVSSSGDILVEGKVQNAKIEANSSGDFSGEKLEVKKGEFVASSSGSILTMVSQSAHAEASSSGDIHLRKKGNPTITKNENSSGSITIQ